MSKISELSDGGSLVSSDYLIAVRSGGNVKVRMDQINVDQVDLGDNEFIRLGNSQDLTMVHTSTQSIINQAGIGDLLIQKAGTTKLTINASGIDVTGTVTADGLTVAATAPNVLIQGVSATDASLTLSSAGITSWALRNESTDSSLYFTQDGTTRAQLASGGDISFYEDTGTTPKLFWDASAESLSVPTLSITDGSITTTAAAGDHTVFNSTGADADFRVRTAANTHSVYVQGNTGNVGIGASSPVTLKSATTLQVSGNAKLGDDNGRGLLSLGDILSTGANVGIWRGAAGAYAGTGNYLNLGGYDGITFTTGAADIASQTERMRLDASGNLGIGGAPTEKLDISQSVNNSVIAKVTNTNSGDLASARVEIYNDNSSFGQLTTYSSGFAYNVLGSNAANWTFLGTSGSNSNGLKIGTLTADPVVFGTSDLERMRIDSSGNLLVGKSTLDGTGSRGLELRADGLLLASKAGQPMSLDRTGSDGIIAGLYKDGAIVGSIATQGSRLSIGSGDVNLNFNASANSMYPISDTAGTLSTGVVDLGAALAKFKDLYLSGVMAAGNGSVTAPSVRGTDTNTGIYFPSAGVTAITRNGVEGCRMDASGNLLVGKSSSSVATAGTLIAPMQTKITNNAATPQITTNNLGWGGVSIDFLYTGTRSGYINVASTSVSYVTSSDQRLKENIADADDAGSKIDAIQVRKFDWKVDGSHQDYGMVAQELIEVAPEAVSGDPESEEMMGVDYSKLVPMMLKEIQSLRARVAALES